jgi:hypothetical protein
LQLLDTIVFVASLNEKSDYFKKATRHLNLVIESAEEEAFVPLTSLIEFDLVPKGRNYTFNQRKDIFDWLTNFVPERKMV